MSGLTLVERQARLAKEKKEKEDRERQAFDFDSWGLGTSQETTASSKPSPSPLASSSFPAQTRAADVLQPVPRRPEVPVKAKPTGTSADVDWGFDDLLGGISNTAPKVKQQPTSGSRATAAPPADPWDLDALASHSTKLAEAGQPANHQGPHGTGSSRRNEDSDDLLGDLGRPTQKARPERPSVPAKVSIQSNTNPLVK